MNILSLFMRRIFQVLLGTFEPLNGAVIASGGGTTARVYMLLAKYGIIPVIFKVLICTKKGEGCVNVAKKCGVKSITIARADYADDKSFNKEVEKVLHKDGVEIVFCAGCIHTINKIKGIYFVNNHPAFRKCHGGKKMYALWLHEHVLLKIKDHIERYPHEIKKTFRTCIEHHEVISRDPLKKGYDIGESLSTMWVDIPQFVIDRLMKGDETAVHEAAVLLQKHVMMYEYISIISNAFADVLRVIHAKKYKIKIGGY